MKRSSSILAAGTIMLALAVAQETLTNESVIKLVESGLAESLIVNMVRSQPGNYSLDGERVLELKNSGVSGAVLAALVSRSKDSEAPPSVGLKTDGKTLVVAVPGLLGGIPEAC